MHGTSSRAHTPAEHAMQQDLCDVCSIDLMTVERIARKMNPGTTHI